MKITNEELLEKIFGESKDVEYAFYVELCKQFTKEKPITKRKYIFLQKLVKEVPGQLKPMEIITMNNMIAF